VIYCTGCIESLLDECLLDRSLCPIKCDCRRSFSMKEVARMLTIPERHKYEEFSATKPLCCAGCTRFLEDVADIRNSTNSTTSDSVSMYLSRCKHCELFTCFRCLKLESSHPDHSKCKRPDPWAGISFYRVATLGGRNIRKCPGCDQLVEKNAVPGCDKIQKCPVCKAKDWCFRCKQLKENCTC